MMTCRKLLLAGSWAIVTAFVSAGAANAAPIAFSSASATFEQVDKPWLAAEMIDGNYAVMNGWAIADGRFFTITDSQTALFTLASPLASGPLDLTFTLFQLHGTQHVLGDFSFGYTTTVGPTLLGSQTALGITGSATSGATFTPASGGRLVVSGALTPTDVYTINASVNSGSAITGFYLNVYNTPGNGLPNDGPGRASNGNFVINEVTLDAVAGVTGGVPEPTTWAMMILGFGAVGSMIRRRRAVVA